jgi:hypothetical protein
MTAAAKLFKWFHGTGRDSSRTGRPTFAPKPVVGAVDMAALRKSVRERTKKARAILAR